jgi:hypothetical protein
MPKQFQKNVTIAMVDHINTTFKDPDLREIYRDNLLSYTSVLADGKFKVGQYLDAVRYVGFKVMGDSNIVAFTRAFPVRFQNYVNNNTSEKDIASYVSSYNKNKLVNLVLEQTIVPSHILNADMYQSALNIQLSLAKTATSEKVRSDAANSILTHLKMPETKKIELDIGIKEDKTIQDLRGAVNLLVAQQKQDIIAGRSNAKDVAHSVIIDQPKEINQIP